MILAVAGMSVGRSMGDSDTEKVAWGILALYQGWDRVCEDVAALGFQSDTSLAAQKLLRYLVAHSDDGKIASEVATHLLARSDSKALTFDLMSAASGVRLSAIRAYKSVFLELVDRAQQVPRTDWLSFQKTLPVNKTPQAACSTRLIKLLVDVLRDDGLNPEEFAADVNNLAAELPNEHVDILNQVVVLAEPLIEEAPNCQRAVAEVKECIGDASGELDIWLRLAQEFPPLSDPEVSRSLLLLTKDDIWNLSSARTAIVSTLVGRQRSGNGLADILSPVIAVMPMNEFADWSEAIIDSPDIWAASWVAWLRKNPAITHFQGLLKRNPQSLKAVAQSADASKQMLLEFLSFDAVAESADLRALTIKSLSHFPHAANHVASWIKREQHLSSDETEGIQAFVSVGPQKLTSRDSVVNYWTILKTCAKFAFTSSCAGIERWLSTLSVPGVPIDESILACFADAASTAKLERDLIRVVAKLQLAIDSATISDDSKATIRSHIREVGLCRNCNGTGSAAHPCISCGGSGSKSVETNVRDICDRCGGDGGAGGRCPKCYGTGWMEKAIHNVTSCSNCAGVGTHAVPCDACKQNGVLASISAV